MHIHNDHQLPRFSNRMGSVLNLVLIGVLSLVLLGGGIWIYLGSSDSSSLEVHLTTKAFRGLFTKEVLDQGEIQSSDNFEIRCQVKSRYGSRGVTVKELVEEGASKIILVTTMITRGGSHSELEIPEELEVLRKKYKDIDIQYAWPFDMDTFALFLSDHVKSFSPVAS